MKAIDWAIVVLPWIFIIAASVVARRYVKGVADFLAAGRAAGRYLVCVAEGAAGVGLITVIAMFEQYYQAGTAILWWGNLAIPLAMLLTLSGFVIYRFRETRALTLAQFFELRYSRRFRIFAGLLAFVSGVVNYGIFPGVSARFFVYYLGLPEQIAVAGWAIPTFALLMAVFLGLALVFVLGGGQLQILITVCLAGTLGGAMMVWVAISMLHEFSFEQMFTAVANVPAQQSLIDPFATGHIKDFNLTFVLISLFAMVYTQMAWQGNQGFNCSAVSAHEAKMGRVLATWRGTAMAVMLTLLSLGAYTYLNHPDFAAGAGQVKTEIARIANPQIQEQMRVPLALAYLLPIGIKGMFASLMLLLMVNVDKSYLHSWGSIFIQDVVMPFRREALSPQAHIRLLRWSIIGVAVWGFCFSLLFNQTTYILMFFSVTGAIYLGGAGSAIIGGLYWKRGTTGGAWCAMTVGAVLGVGGLLAGQYWKDFPFNGQVMLFFAMVASIASYVVVSWLTCQMPFDLAALLHRKRMPEQLRGGRWLGRLLGIDAEFSRGDRLLSGTVLGWNLLLFGVFVVITAWNLISRWPDRWWWNYNVANILVSLAVASITVVWFSVGGLRDLIRLFRRLEHNRNNPLDDGTVVGHRNAGESATPPAERPTPEPVLR